MTVIPMSRLASSDLHLLGNNLLPCATDPRPRNSRRRRFHWPSLRDELEAIRRSLAVHEREQDCEPLDTTGYTLPDLDAALPQ